MERERGKNKLRFSNVYSTSLRFLPLSNSLFLFTYLSQFLSLHISNVIVVLYVNNLYLLSTEVEEIYSYTYE